METFEFVYRNHQSQWFSGLSHENQIVPNKNQVPWIQYP
jgi:hypothetical protein